MFIVKLGTVSVAELLATLPTDLEQFLHHSSPRLTGLPGHEVGVHALGLLLLHPLRLPRVDRQSVQLDQSGNICYLIRPSAVAQAVLCEENLVCFSFWSEASGSTNIMEIKRSNIFQGINHFSAKYLIPLLRLVNIFQLIGTQDSSESLI